MPAGAQWKLKPAPHAAKTPLHREAVAPPRHRNPVADHRAYTRAVAAVRDREARRRKAQSAAELSAIVEAARLLDQLEQLGAEANEENANLREHLECLALPADARNALAARLPAALQPEGELPLDSAATGNPGFTNQRGRTRRVRRTRRRT